MKKKKRLKEPKYETDEQQEIRRFVIILVVVVVLIFGMYLITKYIVKKPKVDITEEVTAGEIDYSIVTVGTMLNKPEKEYYVIIYNGESNKAAEYSSIANKYSQKTNTLPIYYCDLNNALNARYIAKDNTNPNAKNIEELSLGELTLIKVSNGKINKYIENEAAINKELGI